MFIKQQNSDVFLVSQQVICFSFAIIRITARLNNKCFTLFCGLFNILCAAVRPKMKNHLTPLHLGCVSVDIRMKRIDKILPNL